MDVPDDIEEVNLVRTKEDAVNWLVEMTGCSVGHAQIALTRSGGDISDALDVLPSIQNEPPPTTDQEVRRLIDAADARTSCSIEETETTPGQETIEISDDESGEKMIDNATENDGGGIEGSAGRISKKLDVSVERARAALRLAGNDEQTAVDIIERQLKKRKRPAEPSVADIKITDHSPPPEVTRGPWELTLLSWNVDGLCERGISERFSAVISEIKTINPHVVMLQEVVTEQVERLRSSLGRSYDLTFGDRSSPYFNALLITRKVGSLKILDKTVKKFPSTIMGRHFVQVVCELHNKKFEFVTSHLESMKDHSKERTSQMDKVLEFITRESTPRISIFGGDMNIRDFEMNRIKNVQNFDDLWEVTGRDNTTRYTWDTSANCNTGAPYKSKLRFDRIYLRKSAECRPTSFSLVGKTMLQSCDMFPSDHWGLLARFTVT